MFHQKAMSTFAKSHTTFSESLKRGLKNLKRNTLPLKFIILNNATRDIQILRKENLTLSKMFNQKAMSTLGKSHTIFPESLKGGLKDFKSNTLKIRFTIL